MHLEEAPGTEARSMTSHAIWDEPVNRRTGDVKPRTVGQRSPDEAEDLSQPAHAAALYAPRARPVSVSPPLAARSQRGRARAAQDAICGGEEITLTYGFWDDAQRPAVEQQIAAFKELHPNITIEPQVVPWDDYWTKLQTGVAGGSTYDVFWMNADELAGLRLAGRASCSIQPMVDDGSIDVDAYPESLRSIYTFDGQVYGIPRDFDTIALFYNKDLFDTAGVEHPTATGPGMTCAPPPRS